MSNQAWTSITQSRCTNDNGDDHTLGGARTGADWHCGGVSMGMRDFDSVRELGLALPGVVDGTAYGAPALKLHGKLLACVPTNKSAEAGSIVVCVDLEHRAELLRTHPDVYYITEHYAPHPTVLVRLSRITRAGLTELLREAWRAANALSARRTRR
jgi:hypothetical protein